MCQDCNKTMQFVEVLENQIKRLRQLCTSLEIEGAQMATDLLKQRKLIQHYKYILSVLSSKDKNTCNCQYPDTKNGKNVS